MSYLFVGMTHPKPGVPTPNSYNALANISFKNRIMSYLFLIDLVRTMSRHRPGNKRRVTFLTEGYKNTGESPRHRLNRHTLKNLPRVGFHSNLPCLAGRGARFNPNAGNATLYNSACTDNM